MNMIVQLFAFICLFFPYRDVGRRMYEIALRGQVPDPNELLSKNDLIRIKRCIYAQGAGSLPPITTHNIVDDNLDPIMNAFRRCQLFNNHHDRVKVRIISVAKYFFISFPFFLFFFFFTKFHFFRLFFTQSFSIPQIPCLA